MFTKKKKKEGQVYKEASSRPRQGCQLARLHSMYVSVWGDGGDGGGL